MFKKLLCIIAGIFLPKKKEKKEEKSPDTYTPLYPGIAGADPYIDWSLGTGKRYFFVPGGQQEWIPVLVRLNGISARDFADGTGIIRASELKLWQGSLRVPEVYTDPPSAMKRNHCTALVSREFFDVLQRNADMEVLVTRTTLGLPLRAESLCAQPAQPGNPLQPAGDPEAGTVVVGIIDDGIAFAHQRFRRANGSTRVEYMWIQDGIHQGFPEDFCYGSELQKRDVAGPPSIDKLLAENTHAGLVNEDGIYRLSGLIDYRRPGHKTAAWRAAHGTHVMDLACGFDPQLDRDDRPIVCVQLPASTTADTSGAQLHCYAIDAIEYILSRADRIAAQRGSGPLPVVINFSYGTIAGPHDGTSDMEVDIDELITERFASSGQRVQIVLPSGNSHLSRCHAELPFDADGQARTLHWRVSPDDWTPSFVEIWMPRLDGEAGTSRMKLTMTTPGGIQLDPVHEDHDSGAQWPPQPGPDEPRCVVTYKHVAAPTDRGLFLIELHPTSSLDPSDPIAPSGIWTIELESENFAGNFVAEAWIQRDETLYGHPRRGRQSYFDEDCYDRFDDGGRELEYDPADMACHVKRSHLINALATGAKPVVVGGLLRKEMVLPKYSAGGPHIEPPPPNAPPNRRPDAVTVSDDSRVHGGVLAAGSRSGSTIAMNGTSVSAPQIARWIADELAGSRPGGPADVQAEANNQEPHPAPAPAQPPVERGGSGRIKLDPLNPLERYWD